MFDIAATTLIALLRDPLLLGLIALAVPIGMFFGVVPGLGGKLGIVLLIPFVFGMDMVAGAVFLLAMHAVVHTGGSIPSILLGIPGTGPDAATVVDGYPMTLNGQAGRALGASLSASAVGGVIGAAFLALILPLLMPVVLVFGPAEFFLLAILGITFIAGLSGDNLLKGLIVGCFGLMMAMVGLNPQTGEPRFTLGQLFLWDGIDLVTAILAMFAIPEMIALGVKGGSIAGRDAAPARYRLKEVIGGMGDIITYRWLTLRTSLIGAAIGMMPGLGGDAASWICYGHAMQSSKAPERFGKGAVEGVIGPESANNAKEGGSLIPTLFFGVPGSSGMALLLGAFVMLGIQPGPNVLLNQLDLVWTLIWALVLSNILAVAVFLLFAQQLSLIAHLRGGLLIPIVFCLAVLGSLLSSGGWHHLIILMVFGVLGYGLQRYDWPRPPFVIGIVLGSIAETSLNKAMAIWGPAFFLRPGAMILIAIIIASVAFYFWRRSKFRGASVASNHKIDGQTCGSRAGLAISAIMVAIFALMIGEAVQLRQGARFAPLAVGIPALILAFAQLAIEWHALGVQSRQTDDAVMRARQAERRQEKGRALILIGWFAALVVLTLVLGVLIAFPVFVFGFLRWHQKERLSVVVAIAASFPAIIYGVFDHLMGLRLWAGVVPSLFW